MGEQFAEKDHLTEKWITAAGAARRAEHHFPADCLMEAVEVLGTVREQCDDLRELLDAEREQRQVQSFAQVLYETTTGATRPDVPWERAVQGLWLGDAARILAAYRAEYVETVLRPGQADPS